MNTLKNIKWSLILAPIFSATVFVSIITAAPAAITEKMNDQEIQTIAVPAKSSTEVQPALAPLTATSPADTSTPPATPTNSSPSPANTPAPKATSTPSKSAATKPSSQQTKASTIISTSKQYIGVKYVFGGTTPAGFDCSGFVQYVFAKNGINLPRVSRDQYKIGTTVSYGNLQPGDLVFFSLAKNGVVDHEGIYIGNGQFINAASSKGVTIYSLGTTYWKSAFVGAKRVL